MPHPFAARPAPKEHRAPPHGLKSLAVPVSTAPMEAKLVDELPRERGWQFEPKWDGFRCLAFKAGEAVALQAKSGKPLTRYFPEIVDAVRGASIQRLVLDGELVIPVDDSISFDSLQLRLHPAESRINSVPKRLAKLKIDPWKGIAKLAQKLPRP